MEIVEDSPGLSSVFHSFEIYDNWHSVGKELMKENTMVAKGSLDINKPMMLYRLRFSKVASKTEWMNRTSRHIGLQKYPCSKEDLLNISDPSSFCQQLINFGNRKAQKRCY